MEDEKINQKDKSEDVQIKGRKNSWFIRILLLIYLGVLLFLVFQSFYKNSEPYDFNPGLITVLFIITLLILSEAFDNMSIGKLFSLTREVKIKEDEVEKSKEENRELRRDIISLASVVTQNQSNNTYVGLPDEMLKTIGVVKAEKEDEEEGEETKKENIIEEQIEESPESGQRDKIEHINEEQKPASPQVPISFLIRSLHKIGLERFIETQKMSPFDVVREVEFSSAFRGLDPIGDQKIVFDAYYKTPNKEYFIESIVNRFNLGARRFQIYTLIAKVYFYQQVKKTQAEIIIVLLNMPESYESGRSTRPMKVEELYRQFQPAITNGLLRIETVDLSNEDIEEVYKNFHADKS